MGSRDKFEYNIQRESFVFDRIIHSSVVFPVITALSCELGVTIGPTWHNGVNYEPLEVGCIVKARVIVELVVEDKEGEDAKVLSVPVNDARLNG